MKSIFALHHVSLIVANTERALEFYRDILGLSVNPQRPDLGYPGAWLDINAQQQLHLLELPNPEQGLSRPAHGGRDRHFALYCHDVAALAQQLSQADIPFSRSRSGRAALFCRDPDENAVEIMQYVPD
jgi:glyoxylase I family protein